MVAGGSEVAPVDSPPPAAPPAPPVPVPTPPDAAALGLEAVVPAVERPSNPGR